MGKISELDAEMQNLNLFVVMTKRERVLERALKLATNLVNVALIHGAYKDKASDVCEDTKYFDRVLEG